VARVKPITWALMPAAAGAFAAVALASGSPARTASVTVPAFDRGSVAARCPGSQRLGALGFKGSTGRRRGLVLTGLRPGAHTAGASATNVFVNPAELAVTARCTRGGPLDLTVAKTKVPPPSGDGAAHARAIATCPAGTSVQLGGFRARVAPQPPGPAVVVNQMRRGSLRKLVVTAVNGGNRAGRLVAIAGCGHDPAPDAARASATLPQGGGKGNVTAHCPSGEHVVFGGFQTRASNEAGPYVRGLSVPTAKTWRVAAFQFPRKSTELKAIAYCR
jgi:hypothetical protein